MLAPIAYLGCSLDSLAIEAACLDARDLDRVATTTGRDETGLS